MPEGKNSIGDFLSDPSNIAASAQAISSAAQFQWGSVAETVNMKDKTLSIIKQMADQSLDYQVESELSLARQKLEIRKKSGEDVLQEDLALLARETEQQIKKLKNQLELNETTNAPKSILGIFQTMEDVQKQQATRLELQKQITDTKRQADQRAEELEQAHQQRIAAMQKEGYDRMAETRILIAQNTNDKLAEIEAQGQKQVQDIQIQYLTDMLKLISSGLDPSIVTDLLKKLNEAYQAKLGAQSKQQAQQERDQMSAGAKADIEAINNHQQAVIGMKRDGYQKERELAILARDTEGMNLAADLMRLEKGTKEYDALNQKKADAWISANERIRKSDEENAKQRTKDLMEYKASTALALASMTETGLDDIAAQKSASLADLIHQEGIDRQKAIDTYGNDQEILNGIAASYAAKRAKLNFDSEKQTLDAVRKEYETVQQQILTGQLHPLQMILDKENDRVRTLQRANEELQHSLDLIDKRYAKENKAQDLADRAQFDALKGGGISLADLTAGANEIANEDIINGKVTDRSSKATQLRGLKLLLARQAQDAETKRKNEGYDSTNSDLNEQGFASDMARILGRQAAVVEAAKAEAKTAKEKSDLDAEGADLYVKYQQLQKDALAAKQRVEQQGIRDQMDANSALIDQGWDTVTQTKRQMEDLQTAYDVKMKGVSDAFMVAGNNSDVLLAKLKQWAPALAASAQAAVASIKTVTNALNTPIPTAGSSSGSGSSSGAYVGPSRVSTPTPGYIVTDGTYWYKNTSDMYAASATHMASGGVVPGGFEGDNFPALLKTGERVLTPEMNRHFEGMMSRFSMPMPVPSYTHMGDQHIHIGNISRDVDLNKLDEVLNRRDFRNRGQNMGRYGGTGLSRN